MATDDSTTPMKRCTQCKECFPATTEFFTPQAHGLYGVTSRCRNCLRLVAAERRKRPDVHVKVLEYAREYKQRPEVHAKITAWNHSEEGRAYHRAKQKKRRTIPAVLEYERAYNKEYSKRPEAREKNRLRARSFYHSPQGKAYREKVGQTFVVRQRARKRSLPHHFKVADWRRALDYFNGCCAVCGRQLKGLFHTAAMDHWIPLASPDCPGTISTNIVPLCHGNGGCNNSKLNRAAEEWLTEKVGKRKAKVILRRIETYFDWVREQGGE